MAQSGSMQMLMQRVMWLLLRDKYNIKNDYIDNMILIENQHERSHNIKQKQKTKTSR